MEEEQHSNQMAQQNEWVDLHRPYVVNEEDEMRRENEMRKRNLHFPKKAQSAFTLFFLDERLKLKDINPNYSMVNMVKEIAKLWRDADIETKLKYEELAKLDKARYLREYETYVYTKYEIEFDDEGNLIEECEVAPDEAAGHEQNDDKEQTKVPVEEEQHSNQMAQQQEWVDLHRPHVVIEEDDKRRENEMRKRNIHFPMKAQSAYNLFIIEERSKLKDINPNYPMVDMAREIAKLWNDADVETKLKYEQLEELDKARYLKEYESYVYTKYDLEFDDEGNLIESHGVAPDEALSHDKEQTANKNN